MSNKTGISWTESSWNPVVGCSIHSPGCTNCYAMEQAHRIVQFGGKAAEKYDGVTTMVHGNPVWNGVVRLANEDILTQPLRWTRPRLVFANSMSDMFHQALRDDEIFRLIDVMMEANWHTYQVLTKRTDRMVELVEAYRVRNNIDRYEHIWWGTSVEDQTRAIERVPLVTQIRAAVRWLSVEPLLGPLDLTPFPPVDWIVVGGESISLRKVMLGETARPFDHRWALAILRYCTERNIPFHFKQMGQNPVGFKLRALKGDDPDEFPAELRIRQYPGGTTLI